MLAVILLIALLAGALTLWQLQYRPPQDARSWDSRAPAAVADNLDWQAVGGDSGQTKFSALGQITPENVGRLERAWTYRTGEVARRRDAINWSKFETTPIIADGKLVLCTPFNRVVALDPATGKEAWTFDARINLNHRPQNMFSCRGLAQWNDGTAPQGAVCARRVYMATNDRRLIALDARTGTRCQGFGTNGEAVVVRLEDAHDPTDVQISAAPAVVGDVVVVGSSVADGTWAHASAGTVHAFDARSGRLRWTFDPYPNADGQTGAANVWSSISADPARDMVFLPTSSPSPDFFGGERKGDESLANAIVAIRASTGERLWVFQTVHHDLWDYDVPAAPAMFTLHRNGQAIPALAFATKSGFLFVLDRLTGKPLYPVIEKPVPQSDVPGERTSPTQPFSMLPALSPQSFDPKDAFGILVFDKMKCRDKFKGVRNEGLFTPPSTRGTVLMPSRGGGTDWGGVAIDQRTNRLVVNTNRFVDMIKLVPRAQYKMPTTPEDSSPQLGAPYAAKGISMFSPLGMFCSPPPWGALVAIDLDTGRLAWRKTLGTTAGLAPLGVALKWGTPSMGGPLATGSGLVFIAGAMDQKLRAFRSSDGEELWAGDLPAGGQASPMTYAIGGRQYVVMASGGHFALQTKKGDYVVAYALPKK
jgi:quinoprotein glucose dehydrogenase